LDRRLSTPIRHVLAGLLGTALFLVGVQVLWSPPAGVVVQGALLGGLSALLALGLALVYRAHRVLNFAQGDLGAAPASLAVLLLVSSGASWLTALLAGLATAVVLGALVEILVIRRFARSPRLVLTVATIGLAQVLAGLGLLLPRWFAVAVPPQSYPAPIDWHFTVDPIRFGGNDVLAVIVVPVAFVALALFLRSRLGTAMRACADDPERAALVGIPVRHVHTAVWIIASLLAFLAVFLRAGIVGLSIGSVLGPSLLLPALAAAVIGRMEHLPTIAASAIALGIVEQAVVWDWAQPQYVQPVLFVVVLVALWCTPAGRGLRTRAEPSTWRAVREPRPVPPALARLPEVRLVRVGTVAMVAVLLLLVPVVFSESRTNLAAVALVYAVIALSLVVLTGWAGEVSLGQMAFVAIGAAVGGSITARWGADLSLGLLGAGLVGAVVAVVIGLPVLRRRGLTIAVVTLAFSLATTTWLLSPAVFGPGHWWDWLPPSRVERPHLFGFVDVRSETSFYLLCLAALGVAVVAVHALRRAHAGRAFVAVRENDRAAAAVGIRVRATTLGAFAVSGFLAAFAGALFVHQQNGLQLGSYGAGESLVVFAMVVVGGLGSIPGAILGAFAVRGVTWWLPADWQFLVTGAGLLVVLLIFRGGLGAAVADARDAWLRRVARRRGIAAPALLGTETGNAVADGAAAPLDAALRSERRDDALLTARDLDLRIDGATVLRGIDFDVADGEIVALVGTNGSGKSTLLRALSGVLPVSHGQVRLAGEDITRMRPERRVRRGLVQAPGGHGVFPSLTVAENLRVAAWTGRDEDAAGDVLDDPRFPELRDRMSTRAGDLSGGEQQLLTLAMALVRRPRLLLVDELGLGLAPAALARVRTLLEELRATGTTIVVVDQSLDTALAIADRACCLERGTVVYAGPAHGLRERPDLVRAVFLGTATAARAAGRPAAELGCGLQVEHLSVHYGGVAALTDVSLTVRQGEIVALAGPNGAGKTTLFDAVSGFVRTEGGRVRLTGATARDLTRLPPPARARAGLGRSFQDGRLFPALTVRETVTVACARHRHVVTRARVDELLTLLGLTDHGDRFVHELSTGMRRIVELACVLAHEPAVLLLDEPSSGLAQREVEALAPLLLDVRDRLGAAVLLVEHDLVLVEAVADRVVTLELGRVVPADGDGRGDG
jgi:branched-chain amino acid transport system permease protein